MKKKIICWLCVCFILITLSGCSVREVPSEMVTKEYLIEHCDVTERDFEGVDFEEFVDRYKLTVKKAEEYYIPDLIAMYKRAKAAEPTVDYTEIYRQAEGKLREDDIDAISVLIWSWNSGSDNECMVVNLANSSVYYAPHDYFLDACGESRKVADLSQEDAEFLRNTVRDCGVTQWDNDYIGTNGESTGHMAWGIGIQLEDGRCVDYSGYGIFNSGTPSGVYTLMNDLTARFLEEPDDPS